MVDLNSLSKNGYTIVKFENPNWLFKIQEHVKKSFHHNPTEWHKQDITLDSHIEKVKHVGDQIAQQDYCTKLMQENLTPYLTFLGPDIDIQAAPHFRVSRPELESDLVDWHRDTFYGNTPWEVNLWFPVFPLGEGSGLKLLPGSHVLPSRNVREIQDADEFRSQVKKGSTANQIGYVYLPKTDDTISSLKHSQVIMLSPQVGEAVFFFGCMVHRAQNLSKLTRVSIDLRLRSHFAPTQTRPGYYKTLSKGIVETCVQEFLTS